MKVICTLAMQLRFQIGDKNMFAKRMTNRFCAISLPCKHRTTHR